MGTPKGVGTVMAHRREAPTERTSRSTSWWRKLLWKSSAGLKCAILTATSGTTLLKTWSGEAPQEKTDKMPLSGYNIETSP